MMLEILKLIAFLILLLCGIGFIIILFAAVIAIIKASIQQIFGGGKDG